MNGWGGEFDDVEDGRGAACPHLPEAVNDSSRAPREECALDDPALVQEK